MTGNKTVAKWEEEMKAQTPKSISEKEEVLYQQLLALYRDCPTGSEMCFDLTILDIYNGIMDELVQLGHAEYQNHKIVPEGEVIKGKYVLYSNMRMKIYRTIRRMYSELGMIEPELALNQHSRQGGESHYQNNPIIFHDVTQNQHQEQHQLQTLSLEQHLDKLQEIVDTQLDDDEASLVKESLEKFKNKPGVWKYAQPLLSAGATFGRDVAVQFIGSVLAAIVLASK